LGLLLFVCSIYLYNNTPRQLEVIFFDVGQGDSALIITPSGQVVLIDGGPDNTVLRRLGDSLPFYRRNIDLVIFSHYHDDHLTGLIEVLNRYQVKKIIYASSPLESPLLETFLQTAQAKKIVTNLVTITAHLDLATNCSLNFINPLALRVKEDQNNSLIVRLTCCGQKFLFTGDNSAIVEKALINSGQDMSALVLKAAHHGSNTASSEIFLRAVNPRLVVISVGADNKFGHPSPIILSRLM